MTLRAIAFGLARYGMRPPHESRLSVAFSQQTATSARGPTNSNEPFAMLSTRVNSTRAVDHRLAAPLDELRRRYDSGRSQELIVSSPARLTPPFPGSPDRLGWHRGYSLTETLPFPQAQFSG